MKLSWPQVATTLKDRCCKTLVVFLAFFICFTMMMFHNDSSCFFWFGKTSETLSVVFFHTSNNQETRRNPKKSNKLMEKNQEISQVIQFGYFNFRDGTSTPCSYQLTSDIHTPPGPIISPTVLVSWDSQAITN